MTDWKVITAREITQLSITVQIRNTEQPYTDYLHGTKIHADFV